MLGKGWNDEEVRVEDEIDDMDPDAFIEVMIPADSIPL